MTPGSWGGKNLKKAVGSANCLLKKFAESPGAWRPPGHTLCACTGGDSSSPPNYRLASRPQPESLSSVTVYLTYVTVALVLALQYCTSSANLNLSA